jgi:putative FmdB family regulatory protein
MALYSYKCSSCDIVKDYIRGISEPEPKYFCDSCNSEMSRVFQAPGVKFNGSGFYTTDKG